MASPSSTGPARWHTIALSVIGGLGGFATLAGTIFVVTAWPAHVNDHLDRNDKRLDQVEANQKTYIPVVIGMQGDLRYLADRARRDDDRRDREQR